MVQEGMNQEQMMNMIAEGIQQAINLKGQKKDARSVIRRILRTRWSKNVERIESIYI